MQSARLCEGGRNSVLNGHPTFSKGMLGALADRIEPGFRTMDLIVDLVVVLKEPGESRIGSLERMDCLQLAGEFFPECVRRIRHDLTRGYDPTLLPSGRCGVDLDQVVNGQGG